MGEVGTASVLELDSTAELPGGTTYPLEDGPAELTPEDDAAGEVGMASVLLLDSVAGLEDT